MVPASGQAVFAVARLDCEHTRTGGWELTAGWQPGDMAFCPVCVRPSRISGVVTKG